MVTLDNVIAQRYHIRYNQDIVIAKSSRVDIAVPFGDVPVKFCHFKIRTAVENNMLWKSMVYFVFISIGVNTHL